MSFAFSIVLSSLHCGAVLPSTQPAVHVAPPGFGQSDAFVGEQKRCATQLVALVSPKALRLQPYADVVKYTTYSPEGARVAAGSCEKTPANCRSNVYGPCDGFRG